MKKLFITVAMVAFAPLANAVELRQTIVRTGTEGLARVELSVVNETGQSLSCIGQLAHWYSKEVASLAPGDNALVDLWFDPENGSYAILNGLDENMPVEALWCGFAGRAYASRDRIALDRRIGANPKPIAVSCTSEGEKLVCQ